MLPRFIWLLVEIASVPTFSRTSPDKTEKGSTLKCTKCPRVFQTHIGMEKHLWFHEQLEKRKDLRKGRFETKTLNNFCPSRFSQVCPDFLKCVLIFIFFQT